VVMTVTNQEEYDGRVMHYVLEKKRHIEGFGRETRKKETT